MTPSSESTLKNFGCLFMGLGALLLIGSLVSLLKNPPPLENTDRTQSTDRTQPTQPTNVSVSEAREIIPKALDAIYAALNDGDPVRVSSHLTQPILQNASALDFICRPFTFRAYYIEGIAARPNERFLVYLRVLFKPLDERAHSMIFHVTRYESVLEQDDESGDDWWQPQQAAAKEVIRQFLYALKGGEHQLAAKPVSPHFPFSECAENDDVQKHLSVMQEVKIIKVNHEQYRGIKILVEVPFPDKMGVDAEKQFYLEQFNGEWKIVRAFYSTIEVFNWSRYFEDPNLERYTLERFKIREAVATTESPGTGQLVKFPKVLI